MKCQISCPFHKHPVITTTSWLKANGRAYCDTCGKAFDFTWDEKYDTLETEEDESEEDEVSNVDAEGYW